MHYSLVVRLCCYTHDVVCCFAVLSTTRFGIHSRNSWPKVHIVGNLALEERHYCTCDQLVRFTIEWSGLGWANITGTQILIDTLLVESSVHTTSVVRVDIVPDKNLRTHLSEC